MEELYERDDKPQQGNCGIYKIENLINGKVYIGQSICIKNRWQSHKTDGFNPKNKCYNRPLYRAFRKYGLKNFDFSIIELCNPEELNEKEIYWISYYNSYGKEGYNLTPGGNEPIKVHPEELYKLWDEGYTIAEILEKLKINKTTAHKWLLLYPNYSEYEARVRGAFKGANIKREERQGINCIVQYDLQDNIVKEWNCSLREIERQTGFDRNCISAVIKGKFFSSNGFRWGYKGMSLKSKEDFGNIAYEKGKKQGASTIQVSAEEVEYIKKELAKGTTQQKIADFLNISRHIVQKINTGVHFNDGGKYPIYERKKKMTNRPELLI